MGGPLLGGQTIDRFLRDTKGEKPSFAAFARALRNLEEAAVHMAVELKNAAFDLKAAESPM